MRLIASLTLLGTTLLSGCGGDVNAPQLAVGQYSLIGIQDTQDDPVHPTNPFLGPAIMSLDSLDDVIVLAQNRTYQEHGGTGGIDASGHDTAVTFQGQGTYTEDHASVTLIQSSGITVTGGSGSIVGDTLKLVRYPGLWTFVKE